MNIFRKKQNDPGAVSSLKIILEHAGTPLYELDTKDYGKEIIIGRSADCAWTLEGIDSSASSKHAVISKRKNNFYLTDLGSRNGIFFQNKRIKERKLTLGDRISIGECVLQVDMPEVKNRKVTQFHRLEYMDAKGHKTTIDINKPQMTIGSSPDCDVIFQNQLISTQHAELLLHSDGSCWIKDLNSRNGTSVNGMELTSDGERMLQDGDVITIAYLEIRFLDASVEHNDSKLWTTIITLAITVLVIMAGYIGYLRLSPDSEAIYQMALVESNNGHYAKAKELLDASGRAEGAENTRYPREQLRRKLLLWEGVIAMWHSVQQDLSFGNFNRAVQKLSSMDNEDLNTWTWQPHGAAEKQRALAAKRLLDACSSTAAALKNELASAEDVERHKKELSQALAAASRLNLPYLTKVIASGRGLLRNVEKTLNDDKELRETLRLLDAKSPDYKAVISRLKKISAEAGGAVKARSEKILPALITLDRETQRMFEMVEKIGSMDFASVERLKLDLPESIDWSTEKNIGTLRRDLIKTVERFKDFSTQLSLLHQGLVKKGIIEGKRVEVLEAFLSEDNMQKVYQVDCLDMPLPKNARKMPSGKYDELLGVEFFYDFISNIHTQTSTLDMDALPFRPVLYQARDVILEIEKFLRFADRDENQWFNRGKFASYLAHCKKLLALRNKIVSAQLKYPAAIGTREFIISRGIAVYLLPDGRQQALLTQQIEKSFSTFKQKILKLNREYNIAMPEEAVKIRGQIIKIGLPGDAIVKKMWQQRPLRGWGNL